MEMDTTYVALDDSKRKIVAGILRPGDVQPELREIANDARQIRRLFERLKREGPVAACYEAGRHDIVPMSVPLNTARTTGRQEILNRPGPTCPIPPVRATGGSTRPRWRPQRRPVDQAFSVRRSNDQLVEAADDDVRSAHERRWRHDVCGG